ncbi:hypothetical protein CQW23_23302 [Capsicum baccatum]|uniref:Uncharacterized protein n=1 Tax=Capsicum baccatum TaxID=33114 RepID=A0A2G2VRK9_CAPBA|nr:hypothetical protein CQW23_23302 [Capsicum baccatum]
MVPAHQGTMAPWKGTMAPRNCAPLHQGTMTLRHQGTMAPRHRTPQHHGTVHHDTMVPWYRAPWHRLPSHYGTKAPCTITPRRKAKSKQEKSKKGNFADFQIQLRCNYLDSSKTQKRKQLQIHKNTKLLCFDPTGRAIAMELLHDKYLNEDPLPVPSSELRIPSKHNSDLDEDSLDELSGLSDLYYDSDDDNFGSTKLSTTKYSFSI